MGIFRRKKDEPRKQWPFYIDWRLSPKEYIQLFTFSAFILFFVAWTSVIAASLLYFVAVGAVFVAFYYYHILIRKKFRYTAPYIMGLFFLLFSLSGNLKAYIFGAYLSAFFINILGYFGMLDILRRDVGW